VPLPALWAHKRWGDLLGWERAAWKIMSPPSQMLGHPICCQWPKFISDVEASKIMQEILSAVSYIHEKGVIHRDLKTANILIQKKDIDNTIIKIIDFGFGDQ
jgi:serine/threonine protein kinase